MFYMSSPWYTNGWLLLQGTPKQLLLRAERNVFWCFTLLKNVIHNTAVYKTVSAVITVPGIKSLGYADALKALVFITA